VEVCVESLTYKRMHLNSIPFDQDRVERLNTEAVQSRRAVEENIFPGDNFFEHCPHIWSALFDEFVRTTDIECEFSLQNFRNHEWPEEFERHMFRKSALIEFEFWTDDNNRT